MKKILSGSLVAALALAGVVGTSTKAEAAFMVAVCNDAACAGGDDFTFADQSASDTSNIVGAIVVSGSAFGYNFLLNSSQSKPVIGSATAPQLDLTFSASSPGDVGNVFLYASDTDFVGLGSHGFTLALGGTQSGPLASDGTVTGRAWGGSDNVALSRSGANLFGTVGPFTTDPFSGSVSGGYTAAVSPYSLTIGVQINRDSAGTSTGDLNLSVPEPALMALFGLGLVGFGVASRRRKVS